jgi:hypothetical protein
MSEIAIERSSPEPHDPNDSFEAWAQFGFGVYWNAAEYAATNKVPIIVDQ